MEAEDQPDLKSFLYQCLDIASRRWKFFLPFPFLGAIAIYYALSLPPIYRSEGVLLVENQNIPEELIRTTVTSFAAEQMEVLKQQVLSTDNVVKMINAHGLYATPEGEPVVNPRRFVQRFRDNMGLDAIESDTQDSNGRRRVVSIAFRISFRDKSPELARNVADHLIQIFLEGNILTRTREAEETSQFLRTEADSLKENVDTLEDELAAFKSENADSLPELLEYNLSVIDDSELRRRDNLVSIDNLAEQEQLLAIELRSLDPYTGVPIGTAVGDNDFRPLSSAALLSQKRNELSRLATKYSDSHPSIQGLRREISLLEGDLGTSGSSGGGQIDESLLSPTYLEIRYRIGSIERDIDSLKEENQLLDEQIFEFKRRVSNTYIVEREYEELQREFVANSERYEQLRDAQYDAEVAQSLEENNQVESLQVVDRPRVPSFPVGPERPKIMMLGLGLAGAVCFGLAMVSEFLDGRVRGVRGFQRLIGTPPLVAIPKIAVARQSRKSSIFKKMIYVGAILLLMLVAALVADHFKLIDWRALVGV